MENYGKFNSAEELLKGYTELEKSFTQKCQQLSALQKQIQSEYPVTNGSSEQSDQATFVADNVETDGTNVDVAKSTSPQQDSEQGVGTTVPSRDETDGRSESRADTASRPPRIMAGGGNISAALPNRPKTLKEASELAKKYFN